MTHSFNLTNDKYFDKWAELEDHELFEDDSDSNDSEEEGGVTPELYQYESDDEIQLQTQQGAEGTRSTCVICMDRRHEEVLPVVITSGRKRMGVVQERNSNDCDLNSPLDKKKETKYTHVYICKVYIAS